MMAAGVLRTGITRYLIKSLNGQTVFSRTVVACPYTEQRLKHHDQQKQRRNYGRWSAGAAESDFTNNTSGRVLGISLFISLGLAAFIKAKKTECAKSAKQKAGECRSDLPNFRKAEIAKHKSTKDGVWVTYNGGVYDITEFMVGHPGGDKIMLAAGSRLEPFWQLYAIHQTPEVFEILEELRIGNVHPDDLKASAGDLKSDDPFASDPERHPALQVNSAKPFNAEPPAQLLVDNFLTPNELFFVRNHLPVPRVDSKTYKLEVRGEGIRKPIKLSLPDLKKKFKSHTITATMQCAGNRRSEMNKYKEVKGLSWDSSAISTAEWTGVKINDVLAYAGLKPDKEDINYVIFQGLDKDMEGEPYESAVPARHVLDPQRDAILAYEMNGKELPLDHGFPMRVIVPGLVGARNVKWIATITTSSTDSQSHWQQKDYRTFSVSTAWKNADFSKAIPIHEYPVQSVICEPLNGTLVDDDEVTVRGYAWSGGGRGIVRVEVSVDGGKTWYEAELRRLNQEYYRQWAWTLWEITLPVAMPKSKKDSEQVVILCKAIDTSHNTQPESAKGIWNVRGLLHNAWHKVTVKVAPP